jgi:hypothetical protein
MCGTTKRTRQNKTRVDTKITFYEVIEDPMLVHASENWVQKRSERKKV